MDMLKYIRAASDVCKRNNIFQKRPEQVMRILLKHTFSDEDACPHDSSEDEIDYLVQVKGLSPYQATITECWITAKCEFEEDRHKDIWEDEDSCFVCSDCIHYEYGSDNCRCFESSCVFCECSFDDCRCFECDYPGDYVQLEHICETLKRGINTNHVETEDEEIDLYDSGEYRGLANLLIALHAGEKKVNADYFPHPDGEWFTYYYSKYVPPVTMKSLFDLSKNVVITEFDRNDVKDTLPDMMINTIFQL